VAHVIRQQRIGLHVVGPQRIGLHVARTPVCA
jgi:hypothetical protein